MTPLLYEQNERTFTTRGIGALSDAIKCTAYESRNGNFEIELIYPIGGVLYDEITQRRIILAIPSPHRNPQPFRIFQIEKVLRGTITVRAQHISADLLGIPVAPFTANDPQAALQGLVDNSMTDNPFTVWTDKTGTATFSVKTPDAFKSYLAGRQGSILDVYGTGEYEFDRWQVKLHLHRGTDTGVKLMYGKNITKLEQDIDTSSMITGVVPYWTSEETTIIGDIISAGSYSFERVIAYDFTTDFEEQPTKAQLNERAQRYLATSENTRPKVSITVNFADLSRFSTELSEQFETIDLCDTVRVINEEFGLNDSAEVIKTETDVLLERYNKLEIGQPKGGVANTIAQSLKDSAQSATTSVQVADIIASIEALQNGTYYLTPEMFGAKGDGITDDSAALNSMFADAVAQKKPVRFKTKTYNCAAQVNIPGKISIDGCDAVLTFASGSNGLIMTASGAETSITGLTITSADEWPAYDTVDPYDTPGTNPYEEPSSAPKAPVLGTIGLSVSGAHAKITRVNVNNFGTGLLYDERYSCGWRTISGVRKWWPYNQTGVIIDNVHVRYCGVGARLGYWTRNNATTDYTVTNSTFVGSRLGVYICSAIGYFMSNLHLWGGSYTEHGFYMLDCSITSMSNIYVEPATKSAAYVHTRKGINIDNFVFTPNEADYEAVFHFSGPSMTAGDPHKGFHVNLDNIIIRGSTAKKATLIKASNTGVFNIGRVFNSEWQQIRPGVGYDINTQDWSGLLYYSADIVAATSKYNRVMGNSMYLGGVKSLNLADNASGSITYDFDDIAVSQGASFDITVITRDNNDGIQEGRYSVPVFVRYISASEPKRVIPGALTTLISGSTNIAVAAGWPEVDGVPDKTRLEITVNQGQASGAHTAARVIIQPRCAYIPDGRNPEHFE